MAWFEPTRYNVIADLLGLFGFGLVLWFILEARSEPLQESAWLRRHRDYVSGALELIIDYAASSVELAISAGYDLTDEQHFRLYALRLGRTRKAMEAGASYAHRLLSVYNNDARRQAEIHPGRQDFLQMQVEAMRRSLEENADIYSRRVTLGLLLKQWVALADQMLTPSRNHSRASTTLFARRTRNNNGPLPKVSSRGRTEICRECVNILDEIDAYPLPPL